MVDAVKHHSLPLRGGWPRNIAALILLVATLGLCLMAPVQGWRPLGPGGVEGGITQLQDAVAYLAMAFFFGMLFVAFFLFDILAYLSQLNNRSGKADSQT